MPKPQLVLAPRKPRSLLQLLLYVFLEAHNKSMSIFTIHGKYPQFAHSNYLLHVRVNFAICHQKYSTCYELRLEVLRTRKKL